MPPQAFFLPVGTGACFCLYHRPIAPDAARGGIVYVHPFADEMNKSRRMAALQARALAGDGWHVLQVDLRGAGDSAGEFAQADWEGWRDDVAHAKRWLQARTGGDIWLWGLRAGALIASAAAADDGHPLLLWQPVLSGSQYLRQVLRTRVAATAMVAGGERVTIDDLLGRLHAGRPVAVGGYEINPRLGVALDRAELVKPRRDARVAWLEVTSQDPAALAPSSKARVASWRESGVRVEARWVRGLPFWQTQELAEAEDLVPATKALLSGLRS